jgi:predicted nucleic acid-binding protein
VALAWFLDDPVPPYARSVEQALLRGVQALVPALWHLEMANGLIVAERRRILTSADVDASLIQLEQLASHAVGTHTDLVPLRQALGTSRTFQLSAYDSAYLETARHNGLPLATLDKQLRSAASRAGVPLFS